MSNEVLGEGFFSPAKAEASKCEGTNVVSLAVIIFV